jgi:nucleoside-triphosphatase
MKSAPKILLTGAPGVGKTTVIRAVLERVERPARGFYTQEIRESRAHVGDVPRPCCVSRPPRESLARVGFSLNLLSGPTLTLAHVSIKSRFRVGRYGVDVAAFQEAACEELERGLRESALIVIDEIGKMEMYSEGFREIVLRALRSESPVLGTILRRPHPFADSVKAMPGIQLLEVTPSNRDRLAAGILEMLCQA